MKTLHLVSDNGATDRAAHPAVGGALARPALPRLELVSNTGSLRREPSFRAGVAPPRRHSLLTVAFALASIGAAFAATTAYSHELGSDASASLSVSSGARTASVLSSPLDSGAQTTFELKSLPRRSGALEWIRPLPRSTSDSGRGAERLHLDGAPNPHSSRSQAARIEHLFAEGRTVFPTARPAVPMRAWLGSILRELSGARSHDVPQSRTR